MVRNDDKKLIVLLDDVYHADILDIYLMSNNKLPNKKELGDLEKIFFNHAKTWDSQTLIKAKKALLENDVSFLSRSELFCNYKQKKCPLIINNDKIYFDSGHLTNNGAKYFSNRGEKIMSKFTE